MNAGFFIYNTPTIHWIHPHLYTYHMVKYTREWLNTRNS